MLIAPGSKLLMIGDSVTDCGRARPIGEGPSENIGKGYAALVYGWLGAVCPERRIHVQNLGVSGNTVRDLKERWQKDVIDLKPDWLSIMIGINDVWRQFDSPGRPELHVPPEEYASTLNQIVTAVRPTLKGLILLTPFFIELDAGDPMRARMDQYGDIVKAAARTHSAILVDTQAAFNAALAHQDTSAIAPDRVHPYIIGATVLARAFLRAIEFEF